MTPVETGGARDEMNGLRLYLLSEILTSIVHTQRLICSVVVKIDRHFLLSFFICISSHQYLVVRRLIDAEIFLGKQLIEAAATFIQ